MASKLYDKKEELFFEEIPVTEKEKETIKTSETIFNNIKDIFTNEERTKTNKFQHYFKHNTGNVFFNVDNTIFQPSPVVVLAGKNFEKKYISQLEEIIFTKNEELNIEKLFNLIYLMEIIKKDKYPIVISTGKYRQSLPKIINGLNQFFNKNYSTIASILTMFNGMGSLPTKEG